MGSMRAQVFFAAAVFSVIILAAGIARAQQPTCVYFFYGEGCHHCANAEPVVSQMEQKYADFDIHRFEIYSNRTNLVLLNNYFDAYGVPADERGIPAVFIADKYMTGDGDIIGGLESAILSKRGAACPLAGGGGGAQPPGTLSELSLVTVIGAALVDSINPCAIAVLLVLLGALLASGDRRKALKAGIGFTASIYIVYFLFGLGLFSALQISGLSFWFYRLVGFIAIIIGLANIKDYFRYGGGGFVMEIPRRWRPTLKRMLGSVTTPQGAFLMGFAVCLFELPCTGGPYIFILGLLAEKATQAAAIPVLLLYNVFFVLPLAVITFAVYAGFTSVGSASDWKEKNIRKLHLVAGIVMLALGVLVASGLV